MAALVIASSSVALGNSLKEPPTVQVVIKPGMIQAEIQPTNLFDEQSVGKNPLMSSANTMWKGPSEFVIDLGKERHIGKIMFWDLNGHADVFVSAGTPGNWQEIVQEDGVGMKIWKVHDGLDVKARYLQVMAPSPAGSYGEMLVFEYTPEGSAQVMEERRQAELLAQRVARAKEEIGKRPLVESGTLFGKLPLVDEILTGETPPETFKEMPKGVSRVENILGQKARVLPNEGEEAKYFAYRMGEGHYIEPGKAYLLTVDFPDDKPRTFYVTNRGAEMTRGIQTGQALGDVIFTYTNTNLESLDIPQTQEYMTFQQLFWLNDRFDELKQNRTPEERKFSPIGGFFVIIGQAGEKQAPLSHGAAVSRIRLFEVPDPQKFNAELRLPEGLPHRHLFYREEMADLVINSVKENERMVSNPTDWYVYHMRLMQFLGMNTFAKDLLEFGHPQHWDVENPSWYNSHKFPNVWGEIVDEATKHGLSLLPYYEYAGSTGRQGRGQLGKLEKRVMPLSDEYYTHVRWAEKNQVDITDPDTLTEFKRVLDLTIIKYKDKGEILGAWIRSRTSQMPMSFSEYTLARFAEETGCKPMVREDVEADKALLEDYYEWWFGKRKDFLNAIYEYLKENGVGEDGDPVVIFMPVHQEPVPKLPIPGAKKSIVTDKKEQWEDIVKSREDYSHLLVLSEDEVLDKQMYLTGITSPLPTWSAWEWHHATPQADPQRYKDSDGIMLAYPFNRKYTVTDPKAMEAYRTKAGLAMVRHFPLNEDTMEGITGYFVTDFERVGPYVMLPEALAVANGDPWYIGYTSGYIFNRGFPEYVRRFNANYLALPALPSEVFDDATKEEGVVVRTIRTSGQGTYVAIVNTGLESLKDVRIEMPKSGDVYAAVSGNLIVSGANSIRVDLDPAELKTVLVR
ncbi:hypothetical protein [Cerasicoccus fimbriatus]|uniref:hypothetical protein n=1 Tax=Cerasicoccus fimbriatus TaxID=3014554 RepID=UPI0022B46E11|nr:hypothetical protein [Cerasicoccus sp. TK19100]